MSESWKTAVSAALSEEKRLVKKQLPTDGQAAHKLDSRTDHSNKQQFVYKMKSIFIYCK